MASRKERNEIVRVLVMISQLGITSITCMGLSLWIGIRLQKALDSPVFLLLMIVIGIGAVYRSSYLLLRGFLHNDKKEGLDQDERSKRDSH